MKIEILTTNGIKSAFKELNIAASRKYRKETEPRFEVWEIEKSDLVKLEEAEEWPKGWGWFGYSKGSRLGTACNFLTVNGEFMIGWFAASGEDTYDKLTDYLYDGLGAKDNDDVCAMAVELAKANGLTMEELFKTFQG